MKVVDGKLIEILESDLINGRLVIEDNVTDIKVSFSKFKIRELVLPNSIIYINPSLFVDCDYLDTIVIPEKLPVSIFHRILDQLCLSKISLYFDILHNSSDNIYVNFNLLELIESIKTSNEIIDYCQNNNITLPANLSDFPFQFRDSTYSFNNTYLDQYCLVSVKDDCEVTFNFIVDNNRNFTIITKNKEVLLSSVVSRINVFLKKVSRSNNKTFEMLIDDYEKSNFKKLIDNMFRCDNKNLKIKDLFELCDYILMFQKRIGMTSEINDLKNITFKENSIEFVFYLDNIGEIKIMKIGANIVFINQNNQKQIFYSKNDVLDYNAFFINDEVKEKLYNIKRKFDKLLLESYSFDNCLNFGSKKEIVSDEGLRCLEIKDIEKIRSYSIRLESLSRIISLINSAQKISTQVNNKLFENINFATFIGRLGRCVKDCDGFERHFEYEYDGKKFYVLDLDTSSKYEISEDDYSSHFIDLDTLNKKTFSNIIFISKNEKIISEEISKFNEFEKLPIIRLVLNLKEKKFDISQLGGYRPMISEYIYSHYKNYIINNDLLKYFDLSNIVFSNIENMDLSDTNAKIRLSEITKMKGANLTNICLLGQELSDKDASDCIFINTYVLVDITKTITTGAVFDETCTFWYGNREISLQQARLLGIDIINKKQKEIKLIF